MDDPQITQQLNTALYQVTGDAANRVDARDGRGNARLRVRDRDAARAEGISLRPRELPGHVLRDGGEQRAAAEPVGASGARGSATSARRASGGSFFTGNYVQPPQGIYHRDGDVERVAGDDLVEQPVHEGVFRFAGIDDHYFLAAALNPGQARVEFRPTPIAGPDETQRMLLSQTITFQKAPENIRFFYGPKQFDLLRSVDAELVRAINFGIFGFLAVPLLGALQWIYGFVGNYGWAIVLLTILINIAIFPLRHKSVVSMRKMQAVQPQMKAIQDRYAGLKATDPARQKMNTEIMNLYREKGVNPASGCVPMLLQFPVLLAFYSMLSQSIELRGADFGGWITDLSQPDPYYVIPVLMAITMFWQTEDHAVDGGSRRSSA